MIEPNYHEGDRDGDGIADSQDMCHDDPEDRDFEDDDGCPDGDNDGDGIVDARDLCPNDHEDQDSFQDDDGCPDVDNDQDRIADVDDQCPNEAEVYNGTEDEDGCPDQGQVIVRTAGVMHAPERVFFTRGSSRIQDASRPILDAVVEVLNANLDISLVEVGGHSGGSGTDQRSLTVSQERAAAVIRYLALHGVDPQRLRGVGHSTSCPVAPMDSNENRERNRRVEFHIVRRAGGDVSDPPCQGGVPVPTP